MKYRYIVLFFLPLFLNAQTPNRFNFDAINSVKVFENGDSLINAWSGGMNSMQFNTLDLDNDGQEDLLAFDRSGNKLIPFLAKINNGNKRYKYAPQYIESFPEITNWIILADYNCDGNKDIFTHVSGGIGVYQNHGNLNFKWALPGVDLKSDLGDNDGNIYVTSSDYPAIVDVDNDGDLDIFTFGIGNTVQHHENLATCGLDFAVKYWCWGGFEEGGVSNKLTLDACNGSKKDPNSGKTQHSGSTITLLDLKGNGLFDAIIGDISFSNAIALYNDGAPDSAHMYTQDTTFPKNNIPVNQNIFPGFYYNDVNFDGKKDLLVSPSANDAAQNTNSVWLYTDNSTNNIPDFNFVDSAFLQNQMIEVGTGARPILADLTFDDLPDLFVANKGVFVSGGTYKSSVSYYKNTGSSTQPQFTLQTKDFANLSTYNLGQDLHPAFVDLDNDFDKDMLVGTGDGKLHYFENTSTTITPNFILKTPNYGAIDVGNNATPFFFDLDKDGDFDLFIGSEIGPVYYYENTGTASMPNFVLQSSNFGNSYAPVYYLNEGFSVPFLMENNGITNLFIGNNYQGVRQFDSIQSVLSMPQDIQVEFLDGSTPTTNYKESILGLTKKAGRNQILFKAEELKAQGLVYGYIDQIGFNILNSSLPNVQYDGLSVRLKNVTQDSLTSFHEISINAFHNILVLSKGWVNIALTTPHLWDGKSDLIIEFCFKNQINNSKDAIIESEKMNFKANAYADGNGSINGTEGCTLPVAGSSYLRPNIKFGLRPAFYRSDVLFKLGTRNAVAMADLNNDGFLDAILGNSSGGLNYFKGKAFSDISTPEITFNQFNLKAYPNPAKQHLTLDWELQNVDILDIVIYDLTGRQIVAKSVHKKDWIDVAPFTNGVYILTAGHKNKVLGQYKFIVLHE